jgi:hypothetical protein
MLFTFLFASNANFNIDIFFSLIIYLDQKLTWQKHIKAKRQQLNLRVRQMSWLLGRKSKLSLENKTLMYTYKCILKPIWTYGIQLWGCAKPLNIKIIQKLHQMYCAP